MEAMVGTTYLQWGVDEVSAPSSLSDAQIVRVTAIKSSSSRHTKRAVLSISLLMCSLSLHCPLLHSLQVAERPNATGKA